MRQGPQVPLPRRTFLKVAAGAAGAAVAGDLTLRSALAAPAEHGTAPPAAPETVRLGVASYSLRKFPRAKAVEMTKALGVSYINFKSVHLDYDASEAEIETARRELEAAGLTLVGGGTITFEKDTDESVGRYFEYAKRAGMPVMVSTCDPAILPRVERFAKRYDIRVAIHNHGPEDKHYPSPYDVLKHVRSMDRRMGLCIDVGHTVRAGTDVVRAVADAGARLFDMHAKDLRDLKSRESQCVVGEGKIPIADVFRQLQAQRYAGVVNLEYEIDADDPFPGMQRSVAYMRGVLAGLSAGTPRPRGA